MEAKNFLGKKVQNVFSGCCSNEETKEVTKNTSKKGETIWCQKCRKNVSKNNIRRHEKEVHEGVTIECCYCLKKVKNIQKHLKVCKLRGLKEINLKPLKKKEIKNPYESKEELKEKIKEFEDRDLKRACLEDNYDENDEKEVFMHKLKVNEYKAKYIYNYNEEEEIIPKRIDLLSYEDQDKYVKNFYINLVNVVHYIVKNNSLFFKKHSLSYVDTADILKMLMKKITMKKIAEYMNSKKKSIEYNYIIALADLRKINDAEIDLIFKKNDYLFKKMMILAKTNKKYEQTNSRFEEKINNLEYLVNKEDKKTIEEIKSIEEYDEQLFNKQEKEEIKKKVAKDCMIIEEECFENELVEKWEPVSKKIKYLEVKYINKEKYVDEYGENLLKKICELQETEKTIENIGSNKKIKELEAKADKKRDLIDEIIREFKKIDKADRILYFDEYMDAINMQKMVIENLDNQIVAAKEEMLSKIPSNEETIKKMKEEYEKHIKKQKKMKKDIFYEEKLRRNIKKYEELLFKCLENEKVNLSDRCNYCGTVVSNKTKHIMTECEAVIDYILKNDLYMGINLACLYAYTPSKLDMIYKIDRIEERIKNLLFVLSKKEIKKNKYNVVKIMNLIYVLIKKSLSKWVPMQRKEKISMIKNILEEVEEDYNEKHESVYEEEEIKEIEEPKKEKSTAVKRMKEEIKIRMSMHKKKLKDEEINEKLVETYEETMSSKMSFENEQDFKYFLVSSKKARNKNEDEIDFDMLNLKKTHWGWDDDFEMEINSFKKENTITDIFEMKEAKAKELKIFNEESQKERIIREFLNRGCSDEMVFIIADNFEEISNLEENFRKTKNDFFEFQMIEKIKAEIVKKINIKYVNTRWGNINKYKEWLVKKEEEESEILKKLNKYVKDVPYIYNYINNNIYRETSEEKLDSKIYFHYVIYYTMYIYCRKELDLVFAMEDLYNKFKQDKKAVEKIVLSIIIETVCELFGFSNAEELRSKYKDLLTPEKNKENEIFYPWFPFKNENIVYPNEYKRKIEKMTEIKSKPMNLPKLEENENEDIKMEEKEYGPTAVNMEFDIDNMKKELLGETKTLVLNK